MKEKKIRKTKIIYLIALLFAILTKAQTTVPDVEMVFVEGKDDIQNFYIGKFEVTQGQWIAVMGNNPSHFKNGDNYPVEMVSWDDVQEFIRKLNEATGKNYRLPTTKEFIFAARGGNKSSGFVYSGSNNLDDVAWHEGNSEEKTHPVGVKAPNELGIYDICGNVYEWCADIALKASSDFAPGIEDKFRFHLGASYSHKIQETWLSVFAGITSNSRMKTCGFRLAHP